ncbi:MAG: PHP domain-containing protein [Lachnospiraceae bacterium]
MKLVDLHVHSTCSDGTLTPSELVSLAKKTGLSAFALTDHDTVKGLPEAMEAGKEKASRSFPALSFPRNTREKIFIS